MKLKDHDKFFAYEVALLNEWVYLALMQRTNLTRYEVS